MNVQSNYFTSTAPSLVSARFRSDNRISPAYRHGGWFWMSSHICAHLSSQQSKDKLTKVKENLLSQLKMQNVTIQEAVLSCNVHCEPHQ